MHTCCKGQATEAGLRQADTGETSWGGKRTAGTFRVLIIYMIYDQILEYLCKNHHPKIVHIQKMERDNFCPDLLLGFFPWKSKLKTLRMARLLLWWAKLHVPSHGGSGGNSGCVTWQMPPVERHLKPCSGNDLSFIDIQPWLHETSVPPINHLRVPVMIVPSTIAMRLEQENLARCMMLVCQSFCKLEGGGVCGFTVL